MRGDEVNGRRREQGEQIWTGNLRMLHEHDDDDDDEERDGDDDDDDEEEDHDDDEDGDDEEEGDEVGQQISAFRYQDASTGWGWG